MSFRACAGQILRHRLASGLAGLLLVASTSVFGGEPPPRRVNHEATLPIRIEFDLPKEIVPGAPVEISGRVQLQTDAPGLVLRFEGEGAVELSQKELDFGAQASGATLPFSKTITILQPGRSVVRFRAEVQNSVGEQLMFVRETVYALVRADRSFVGTGDFMQLELQALDWDRGLKSQSSEQLVEAYRGLVRMTPSFDESAPKYTPPSDQDRSRNVALGAPPEGYRPLEAGAKSAGGTITIQGATSWQDENGTFHPVWGATIEIWDEETFSDDLVVALVTDVNGNYSVTIDNDDGFLQGDRDIYVRYRTANSWVDCQNTSGNTYQADSPVHDETPDGSVIIENFSFGSGGNNDSNSVFQAGTRIAGYVANDVEPGPFPQVALTWPNGSSGSFFGDGKVQIEQDDRWDWDTIHHEYGHYAMALLGIEDNPGGPHNIGDCIAEVQGSKDLGTRLAWGEGWPTYFGTSGQAEFNMAALGVPRVGDTMYSDLEDGTLSYSLESQTTDGRGEDNEVAVQRLLWDLYDGNSDSRDAISRSDNSLWNAIKGAAGAPQDLSHYWNALRSGQSTATQLSMGEISSDQLIGPRLLGPVDGALVTPANRTFSWQGDVGCPSSYSGDSFDLVFYDASTDVNLLTVSGLTTTSYTLSLAELQSLSTATHQVVWAVEGRHTGAPATGPYLGENFAATVNQPPVADAGPDLTVECTHQAGTPVTMNGTGSSDPDGDTLSYNWSAPGVSFAPPNSPTPTGDFPLGGTTATLVVSDGIQADDDTVNVTVQDTVPPSVTILEPTLDQLLLPNSIPVNILFSVTEACGVAREVIYLDGCAIYDGNLYGDGDGLLRDELLTLDEPALCRIVDLCGQREWHQPTFTVRVEDVGGNVANSSRQMKNGHMVAPMRCQ